MRKWERLYRSLKDVRIFYSPWVYELILAESVPPSLEDPRVSCSVRTMRTAGLLCNSSLLWERETRTWALSFDGVAVVEASPWGSPVSVMKEFRKWACANQTEGWGGKLLGFCQKSWTKCPVRTYWVENLTFKGCVPCRQCREMLQIF